MRICTISLLCLWAPAAVAQTAEPAPAPRSQGVALALSLGGTATSIGLMVGGTALGPDRQPGSSMEALGLFSLVLSPSLGHYYADGFGATTGLWIRLGGFAIMTVAVIKLYNNLEQCLFCDNDDRVVDGLLIAGGAVVFTGAVWDIVTAPAAATRHNEKRRIALVPTASGVLLVGTF